MRYLSVIVPAYNSEKTLEGCLEAVRQSSFRDYELIVVDSGSRDATRSIAEKYCDKLIDCDGSPSSYSARSLGIKAADGEVLVNVDSDVVIRSDSLSKIAHFLSDHKEFDAVTGMLSKENPYPNFFSQYKNLYMYYVFSRLPREVKFLYGSIFAVRRQAVEPPGPFVRKADDTALGQQLAAGGRRIAFLRDLEVLHLKKYTLLSFIENDYQVPFDWARIFLKFKGWKQLGRGKTGFLHSPRGQLVSVILAPAIVLSCTAVTFGYTPFPSILSIIAWSVLNLRFLIFLKKERGTLFGILAFFITFLDNIVMAAGIACGFIASLAAGVKGGPKRDG